MSVVDRGLIRQLLRKFASTRLCPYHLQDSLFLLSMWQPSLSTSPTAADAHRGTSSLPLPPSSQRPQFGVDANFNPVEGSRNLPIDAPSTFRVAQSALRRALRRTLADDVSSLGCGVNENIAKIFVAQQRQAKVFWLMRRLEAISKTAKGPGGAKVPSAGAMGVHTSIFTSRSTPDAFTLTDEFCGLPPLSKGDPLNSVFLTNPVARATQHAQSTCSRAATVSTPEFELTIDGSCHYEEQFKPHPSAVEDDGTIPPSTQNRFLLNMKLTTRRPKLFHVVMVNSHVFSLDLSTQSLTEEIGSLVNPGDISLIVKSERLRTRFAAEGLPTKVGCDRNDVSSLVSFAPPVVAFSQEKSSNPSEDATAAAVSDDANSLQAPLVWRTTMITSSNGPVVLKGLLYFKVVIDDVTSSDDLAAQLAQSSIVCYSFGPLALRPNDCS